MPAVTVPGNSPSGSPMAMASWPTWSADESPSCAVGQAGGLDLDEREVGVGVDALDRALEVRPSASTTLTLSASSTT